MHSIETVQLTLEQTLIQRLMPDVFINLDFGL
jgi:hypothetical protein